MQLRNSDHSLWSMCTFYKKEQDFLTAPIFLMERSGAYMAVEGKWNSMDPAPAACPATSGTLGKTFPSLRPCFVPIWQGGETRGKVEGF